ncbi:multiple sugar transport system permease protein/putative aldouronate transport system permease protein [Paenibacillus cellulosilyticus]|uniref:Multiple sugar transport system permease protein/putative aldouronate transport system permease protein n=1 Tax=Paenibacillus cellulosilyticus TaxID=375489 RepID=A0A2V2YUR0_9BACL|nr:carbohydrate ABC transporter permease [Paenibacillus cellulosilyticus]PWW03318.1 multiple sugar transport system permease protein/putative aldouronate transport system permease protein [Paenibacillus cellulosilyticus]QKS43792.1 carbohydrate ABC transporter permease [Paenibacillus cellulosilyticus]
MVTERSMTARLFNGLNLLVLIVLMLLCLLPVWYTLSVSLSDKASAAAGQVFLWPRGFTWGSYETIMKDDQFFRSFWISIQRVVCGAAIAFFVILLMAYPLSKTSKDFKPRNIIMWLLVFAMLFNGGLVPWYLTMQSLGMINNIWGLVLGGGLPVFNVILVMNYLRNMPKEMEESAMIDGAGPWRILFSVCLPLSVPVLATIMVFTIVYHWNEFFQALVLMNKADHYPLQSYIRQVAVVIDPTKMDEETVKRMSELSNQTLNAAKIFISMLPLLVIYPFLQKYFVKGITLGSVKG